MVCYCSTAVPRQGTDDEGNRGGKDEEQQRWQRSSILDRECGPVVQCDGPPHCRHEHQADECRRCQSRLSVDHLTLLVASLSLPPERTPTPTVSATLSSASSRTQTCRLYVTAV